jgi:uncharacterized protein DUF4167
MRRSESHTFRVTVVSSISEQQDFMSNRIESDRQYPKGSGAGRTRAVQRVNGSSGNARTKQERYLQLAQEALRHGDRVEAENCYQHADHFYRVMQGQD